MNKLNEKRKSYIENEATKILREIWEKRESLWPNARHSPFDVIDPKLVCEFLKIEYIEHSELGDQFSDKGVKYKIAGLIDRQQKKIVVSRDFPSQEIRFTAAHEIGHWLLHPNQILHRDRPISNFEVRSNRPTIEKEADYFSACLLMPKKLLKYQFQETFFTKPPLHFDDTISFWLNPQEPEILLRSDPDSLDRELALAKCEYFNGININSLANQFKVSNYAMALRIKELSLIIWP